MTLRNILYLDSFSYQHVMLFLISRHNLRDIPKKGEKNMARQHVVPVGDDWGVRGERNSRLTEIFDTQAEAIDAGKEIAQNQDTELIIHGRDGQIRARESYGSDPFPPRDREH